MGIREEVSMTIPAILKNKGAEVISVEAGTSLRDALQVMDKHQIGALIVQSDEARLQGIFTERDFMRAVAHGDAKVFGDPVSQHMSERPKGVTLDTSIQEAMEIMTEMRFRHMPVIKDDSLCGIISLGDLVSYRINETEREAQALKEYITSG
jgi:CBS domain-containing protein